MQSSQASHAQGTPTAQAGATVVTLVHKTPAPYMAMDPALKLSALNNLPPALRAAPHWLLCRFSKPLQPNAKWRKVPVYAGALSPRTGDQGTPRDRAQLVTYDTAMARLRDLWDRGRTDFALGVAILPDSGIVCVDLDGEGAMGNRADMLASTYAERSVSGQGAHAWYAGKAEFQGKNHDIGLEMFAHNGYVVVTGLPVHPGARPQPLAPLGEPVLATLRGLLGAGAATPAAAGVQGPAKNIPTPWTPELAAKVSTALGALDPDMPYPDWARVGMALHSADPDYDGPAFVTWLGWSKRGAKFVSAKDLRAHWKSFSSQGGVTIAALFAMYRERTGKSINAAAAPEPSGDELDFPASRPDDSAPAGGDGVASASASGGEHKTLELEEADIRLSQQIDFMWPGRIPTGELVLLCGEGGVGKGTATCSLVARLIMGLPLPGEEAQAAFDQDVLGNPPPEPMSVLWFSAEDDIRHVVTPRLVAAGADPDVLRQRVSYVTGVRERTGAQAAFSLATDIDALAKILDARPDVKLVVIDPITSYVFSKSVTGRERAIDTHNAAELRSVIDPLVHQIAHRYRVTILGITHFMKDSGRSLLHRIMGSAAWAQAARAALACVEHPDNVAEDDEDATPADTPEEAPPPRYVLVPIKLNLGRPAPALVYSVESTHVHLGDGNVQSFGRTAWGEVDAWLTPARLTSAAGRRRGGGGGNGGGRPPERRNRAEEWLRNELASGPRNAAEIDDLATTAGITVGTLRRARATLNVQTNRVDGHWTLSLPAQEPAA